MAEPGFVGHSQAGEEAVAFMQAWRANVTIRKRGERWVARCRKGLWRVEGADEIDVGREALHYFGQYYADGEYAAARPRTPTNSQNEPSGGQPDDQG